nr:hypothetical protein [Tanacetum cinerariifolium]
MKNKYLTRKATAYDRPRLLILIIYIGGFDLLSLDIGYVAESDLEEDPEEYEDEDTKDGLVDYPMDMGDDGDDDDGDSSGMTPMMRMRTRKTKRRRRST